MSINLDNLSKGLSKLFTLETLNKRLSDKGLPLVLEITTAAKQVAQSSGARSQQDVAVLALSLSNGGISGQQLTDLLKASFPTSKVGVRHGPHYLSLARTGKLTGLVLTGAIPHADRKRHSPVIQLSVTTPVDPPKTSVVSTEKLLADVTELLVEELNAEKPAAEPVVEAAEPVVEAAEPVVEAAEPVVEAAEPVVEAAEPVVEAAEPVVIDRREQLERMSTKEIAAEAGRVGVKNKGSKRDTMIAAILEKEGS